MSCTEDLIARAEVAIRLEKLIGYTELLIQTGQLIFFVADSNNIARGKLEESGAIPAKSSSRFPLLFSHA